MLVVSNLTFAFGESPLFEKVNFRVSHGQKVGLVGPNGAGKTTLLSLLLGRGGQSSGEIEHSGTIAYLPQEIKHDPTMEAATEVLSYVDPQSEHESHEILKLFKSLELSVELTANPQKLSGGQKTKLALARALLSKPDILLLDEPTNFMDIAGKKWVMNFLGHYHGSVICISHDLDLMDSSIDKIIALNPVSKSVDEYTGNYTSYQKQKAEREALQKRQILVAQKHIARMEKGLKKMARANRFTGAKIKQIHRIEKAREALPEMPSELRSIKIRLPIPANVGEIPVHVQHVSKSYGDKQVLKDVTVALHRGERIALVGPNGAGKSTFIKIIMGLLSPDSGNVVRHDALSIGYYSQEFETFNMKKSVIDVFTDATHKDDGFARAFLARYNFPGDKAFQIVETLSGGEKTRLSIACLTGQNHNLLILDEPTTYLDVMSQRIILEAIKEYQGAMIIVSHTPEFLIELAPTRAYLFPEERLLFWDPSLVSKVEEI